MTDDPMAFLSSLILALAAIHGAIATPHHFVAQRTSDQIVTPGPGLLSLESLNLTSAELYAMKPDLSMPTP